MHDRVANARVARLATTGAEGQAHVVPCCFVLSGDVLYSAVDAKPKSTARLQRIRNLEANPEASLVVDHYEEDWTQLWWVRVDGTGRVVELGAEHDAAIELLTAKYAQYRNAPPPGPVIAIDVHTWRAWSAAGDVDLPAPAFATIRLNAAPDAIAPDGSEVRLLSGLPAGGLAQFTLPARMISVAVRHRTVSEIWFVVDGRGEMWRAQDGRSEIVELVPGTSLTIPVGTAFQFRSTGDAPLVAVGVTMGPWPGAGEAVVVEDGAWEPTLESGPA